MVRRGAHKFIHAPGDPDQLYDLARDPDELVNLAASAAEVDIRAVFRRQIAVRWDLKKLDAEVRESQRRRRLVDAALSRGAVRPWDFQPFQDASKQYVRNTLALDDIEAMARFPRVAQK